MRKIFNATLIVAVTLAALSFASCEEEDKGNFSGTGTYVYDGVEKKVASAWWWSEWPAELDNSRLYGLKYTPDPSASFLGDNPDDYVILYISDRVLGGEFDLLAPPQDKGYFLLALSLHFGGSEVLVYRAGRDWDNDQGQTVSWTTVGKGQTINDSKITVTTDGDSYFSLDFDITVNGKSVRSSFTGKAERKVW